MPLTENQIEVAAESLFQAEISRLYRNNRDGTFSDITELTQLDKALYSMGCNFGDLDNDGWLDFYVGTGAPDLRSVVPPSCLFNSI